VANDQIFFSLSTIRPAALLSPGAGPILKQACDVICATLNQGIMGDEGSQEILDRFIDASMKRREVDCQEAVANLYGCVSGLRDASKGVVK
jgi:hypothetical protein